MFPEIIEQKDPLKINFNIVKETPVMAMLKANKSAAKRRAKLFNVYYKSAEKIIR